MKEEFLLSIDQCKDDNSRYLNMLIYADWLEEHGFNEHIGWRWIVLNEFKPWEEGGYLKYHSIRLMNSLHDEQYKYPKDGNIPQNIFKHLKEYRLKMNWNYVQFLIRIEAEKLLAQVIGEHFDSNILVKKL